MNEDVLELAVRRMMDGGARFCDARSQGIDDLTIRSLNGVLRELSDKSMAGIALRARIGGRWGFASTTSMSKDDVLQVAEKAVRMASSMPVAGIDLDGKAVSGDHHAEVKLRPEKVSLEEKVASVLDLDKSQEMKGIINRVAVYSEEARRNHLVNSFGSNISWEEVRTRFRAMSIASEGDRLERYYEGPDGFAGYELVKDLDIEQMGRTAAQEALLTLKAVKAPSGPMTVISDPMMTGLLAHEVMGHASEADEVVKGRSFLSDKVGRRVGSDLVTLVDDGSIKSAHGYIPFDDEGTRSSRTVIIENGVYKGFMHNLETAARMGVEPTGNGRCENFGKRNWVRMTNTFIEAGDRSLDEMISEVRNGVICDKMINGMEDPVGGGFEAKVLRGHIIKDGRIADMVRSFTLTGRALQILGTVDAVGDTLSHDGGYCGKGIEDWVPVSSGGPYMRSQMIVGGG